MRVCLCVSPIYELVTQCIAYSALEELDATYDSDNEADYTKMDMVCVCRKKLLTVTSCNTGSICVMPWVSMPTVS